MIIILTLQMRKIASGRLGNLPKITQQLSDRCDLVL